MISGFKAVLFREIKTITRDKSSFFLNIIGPTFSFILIYFIFINGTPRNLPVGIVDNDYSSLSRTVNRMIDATPIAKTQNFITIKEAQTALEKGEIEAIIHITKEFEKNILNRKQADIPIYLNNTNVLKSGLLNSAFQKTLVTLSTGIKLKYHLSKGNTTDQAIKKSNPLMLKTHVLFNPYLNYGYFLASALMPMLLILFILLSSVYTYGSELQKGRGKTLLRLSNNNFIIAICAKSLPYTILYICNALFMNFLLFVVLKLPLNGNYGIILLSELFLIISYQFLAIFFVTLFKNMRFVLSIVSAYSMMALTFSGLTFPLHGMPVGAQVFAQIFPFTHWLHIFIGQSLQQEALQESFSYMNIFIIFITLGVLCLPRLHYILQKPKYWGRE